MQENDSSDADTSSTVKVEDKVLADKKSITSNVSSTNKKSKKKKKKNKSKELSSSAGDVDPLDVLLNDLSFGVLSTGGQGRSSKQKSETANTILHVDPKLLNGENELRRIFGSKVVDSFERSNLPGSSRQSRTGRRVTHTHRKTIIVNPSDHWPRWDGSLSMELLENKKGCNYFRQVLFAVSDSIISF